MCVLQVCLAPPGGQGVRPPGQNHCRPGPKLRAGALPPGQAAAAAGLEPEIVCGPDQRG